LVEIETAPAALSANGQFFKDILEIYSPSEGERPVAEYIVAKMREMGYREAYIDEAGNAVGEIGATAAQAAKTIVLLGHIDTVTGFIPVRIEDDTIYGRGSVDAKGPIASFVLGAAALLREEPGLLHDKRIVVVGAVEEEAPTSKGARYAMHQYRPDFCIIGEPSSWDRVTIAYKGSLQLQFDITREMKHGAAEGATAAEEAVIFFNKIRAFADEFSAGKKITESLQVTLRAINSESDGFSERGTVRVGMRIPLGFDTEAFRVQLQTWAGDGELRVYGEELPVRSDKNSPLVRAFYAAIREEGGQPAPKSKTGTSDMNVLAPVWGCPFVAYGPGDSSLDHTPNEHASLAELEKAVRVIRRVLGIL
jgi:[amino group carrier protein]-lysine/ornithine hydrolase